MERLLIKDMKERNKDKMEGDGKWIKMFDKGGIDIRKPGELC